MDVQPRLHLGFARSEARRPARVANVRAKAVRRSSPMIRLPMWLGRVWQLFARRN